MRQGLLLMMGALLLGGCVQGRAREVQREPSATGAVSEEAFKALHTLRKDAPPPLQGEEVEVAGTKAYLSLPQGVQGPLPAVLVIHEWWGLNPHIKHWADRLAAEGYAALAVDLYGGKVATSREEALSLLKAVDAGRAQETLKAAHAFLQQDARIQAPRTGSIGWCFGGGWSLRTAMAIPELDAAVIYYGNPVTDPKALAPIQAQVLGIFGTRDASIPPETVQSFRDGLDAAGVRHYILEFEADHAFANPSGERYDGGAAAGAWQQVAAFLDQHLRQ
ncbi:Dienelactone hydrolase family [Myxococcus hansupus]|uniref:Dienelactone hydrolase family n=1 Tax=Pseudomyxococcus hansupus TaxID=1297742 RepID=A0A0H4X5K3_9BACT|nr:dienelactone hydrolase family protein [Myxococcus hansupus]AKQ70514.1 Dienelactone hydrolase family [Myxococcus hansupus]